MKKIILRSASVVLALAMLFTMAMLFSGCNNLDPIGYYSCKSGDFEEISVHIYKHDTNGSLYCQVDYYNPSFFHYSSDNKKIEPNATQIAKIKVVCSKSDAPTIFYYITLTLISGKWGEKGSKIQADVYKFTGTGYRWLGGFNNISFIPFN